MIAMEFRRWRFEADPGATRAAYRSIPAGGPELCGCLHCRNFAAARPAVYPPEALALFERLGVPPDREAEIWEYGPAGPGRRSYGGIFHFIGRALSGRDAFVSKDGKSGTWDLESLAKAFALGLTSHLSLVPEPFGSLPVLQIDFQAEVPWVLEQPAPD
jgi:hypothetical protein